VIEIDAAAWAIDAVAQSAPSEQNKTSESRRAIRAFA
jgi:hypothetical protein